MSVKYCQMTFSDVFYLVPILYEGVHLSFSTLARKASMQERMGFYKIKTVFFP